MKKAIVFDINFEYIKAGFSGEEKPRFIIPNVVGLRSKSHLDEVMKKLYFEDIKLNKEIYFGKEAIKNRFNLNLKRPVDIQFKIEHIARSQYFKDI